MTKERAEEILSDELDKYLLSIKDISHGTDAIPHIIKNAILQAAKEDAIAFAKWITHNVSIEEGAYYYWSLPHDKLITEEELYQLYINQQQKEK